MTMAKPLFDHLPEELLVNIMKQLDPMSMQCLRRASRIFLRLSCDRSFDSHWRQQDSELYSTRFPWYRGGPAPEKVLDFSFHLMVHFDTTRKLCRPCRGTNIGASTALPTLTTWDLVHDYLFCTACLVDHPKAFFFAAERNKASHCEIRTCIGYTG